MSASMCDRCGRPLDSPDTPFVPKPEEAMKYLWEDYKMRQTHYWGSVNRFALAIITLLAVPHVQFGAAAALRGSLWFLPTVGLILSLAATWLLGAEYQRLRSAKMKYEELLTSVYRPVHPKATFWQNLFGGNIGMLTTASFGIGFVGLSIVDLVLLSGL